MDEAKKRRPPPPCYVPSVLSAFQDERSRIQSEINDLESELDNLEGEYEDTATGLVNTSLSSAFKSRELDMPREWDCEKSPTGHCVYRPAVDPCRDSCLFCFDPLERK